MDNKITDALLEVQQIMNLVEQMSKENTKEILEATIKDQYKEVIKESLNETETVEETETVQETETTVTEKEESTDESITEMDYDDDLTDVVVDTDDMPDIEIDTVSDTPEEDEADLTVDASDKDHEDLVDFLNNNVEVDLEFVIKGDDGDEIYEMEKNISEMKDEHMDEETLYEIEIEEECSSNKYESDSMDETDQVSEGDYDEMDENLEEETIYEIHFDESDSVQENFNHRAPKPNLTSLKNRKGGTGNNPYSHTPNKFEGDVLKPKTKTNRKKTDPNALARADVFADKPKTNNALYQREAIERKVKAVVSENKQIKAKLAKYQEKLPQFKQKIEEMGLYTYKLTKVTKLFVENAVSKTEKVAILETFDNATSTKDCDKLYNQYVAQFKGSNTIEESIDKTPKAIISESKEEKKTVMNEQLGRMKDLIGYTHKK